MILQAFVFVSNLKIFIYYQSFATELGLFEIRMSNYL